MEEHVDAARRRAPRVGDGRRHRNRTAGLDRRGRRGDVADRERHAWGGRADGERVGVVLPEKHLRPVVGEHAYLDRVRAGRLIRGRFPEPLEALRFAGREGIARDVLLQHPGVSAVEDFHVHDDAGGQGSGVLDGDGDRRRRAGGDGIRRR